MARHSARSRCLMHSFGGKEYSPLLPHPPRGTAGFRHCSVLRMLSPAAITCHRLMYQGHARACRRRCAFHGSYDHWKTVSFLFCCPLTCGVTRTQNHRVALEHSEVWLSFISPTRRGYQSLGNDKEGPDDQPMPAPRKSEKKSKKSKKSKSEKKSKQNK